MTPTAVSNMATLHGKTLFITGASRDIGLEIALRAARDGANIIVAAKTEQVDPRLPGTISSSVAAIEAAGGRLSGVFVCPHAPADDCECRKPRTGLMRQIEQAFGCSLEGVPAIGDSERDLVAALAVGARAMLVRTGKGRETEAALALSGPVEVYDDLAAAARAVIGVAR